MAKNQKAAPAGGSQEAVTDPAANQATSEELGADSDHGALGGTTDEAIAPSEPPTGAVEAPGNSAPASLVLARVLARCYLGEPDDVVEIEADMAPSLAGLLDTNPAAVEYASSLKA